MKVLLLIVLLGMLYFVDGISTCSFRTFACKLTCRVGKLFNKDCRKCDCESKPKCPPLCNRHCPNGHVIDSNGCATCECKSPVKRCPPVCPINCPNGKVLDRTGCPICQCRPVRPLFPKRH
uniref:BPTI/Kunitz domain-containing protein 4-like n=1 Tax=Crassostrea virginica TaxID=6565 RepID=A0A8B8EHE0_CRAVI|nr:BPTI/Kunitz domain-containing protein 4-like [Crassostrea virginica]